MPLSDVADTVAADVLDALYDLFIATTPVSTMIAAGSLRTFDGPPTEDWGADYILCVGGRAIVDDEDPTSDTVWDYETSGLFAQVDEQFTVPCVVAGVDGTPGNMRTLRRTVINLYAACARAARLTNANGLPGTGGLVIGNVMWCLPRTASIRQLQGPSGAECHVNFLIDIKASI